MSEIFPEKMLRVPVRETLLKVGHFLTDHLHYEHEAPVKAVPVLVGELKPVMRFPYDSEGTAVEL